jgi:hypothetical protein
MTRTLCTISLVLVAAACTRHNPTPGGDDVGGNGATAAGDDGGAAIAPAGDMATTTTAPPPMPQSGMYAAASKGLLANSCTVPPDDDLGTWALTVVSPSVWNVTLGKGLGPAVLNLVGGSYVGKVAESGMPIWGCTMRETYKLALTATSDAAAQGRLDTVFDVLDGDCSGYEPVLPCTQSYSVVLSRTAQP